MKTKNLLFALIAVFQFIGCTSTRVQTSSTDIFGIYKRPTSTEELELSADMTYTLMSPKILFTPVIERCYYASEGKWSIMAENVIEITSDNYYNKQKGFEYEIKKENKFSQDSLYIQVVFPTDFHPVKLRFNFDYNNSRTIVTDTTYIVLPKSKYLRGAVTQLNFTLYTDVLRAMFYSRMSFSIFEGEGIYSEKHNHLTITLPNFDRCFFEFKPFRQELILLKGKNKILWQGDVWKKVL